MVKLRLGQLVSSKQGRDAGKYYLIIGIGGENSVLVADGLEKKVGKPKKKNPRHLNFHQLVAEDVEHKLRNQQIVTDDEIINALRSLGVSPGKAVKKLGEIQSVQEP